MISIQTPDQNWRRQKAKLKLMFPHLDSGDFYYDYGMKEVMMTNLQAKLGKSREELNTALKNLVNYDAIKSKISLDYHGINSELNILRYDNGITLVERYKLSK